MAFVIDRSLYLSPEVVGEPGLRPLKGPQTAEHFIAWLESKPADGAYCYYDSGDCLYFHYGLDHGSSRESAYMDGLSAVYSDFVFQRVAPITPNTFGAALSRARKLLAEREK